jgi:hypothetical protein
MNRTVLAACITTMAAGGALAQSAPSGQETLADAVIACTGIDDDGERLACYDAVVEPLLGLAENEDQNGEKVAFVGTGHWDSETFTMDKPFRLAWQSKASSLTIELNSPGGELLSLIGPQIGEGSGRTDDVYEPGDYQLGIRASDGEWRVQAVEE